MLTPELVIAAAAMFVIVAAVSVLGWRRAHSREPRTRRPARSAKRSTACQIGGLLIGVWNSIQEPRVKKLLAACAYTAAVLVGVHTIREPPSSLQGVLGLAITTAWGVFYLAGGLLGLGSVVQGWWWLERLGIYTILIGAGLYLIVIFFLHLTSETGNRLPQYWAIFVSVPMVAYRLTDIWKLPYEPRR